MALAIAYTYVIIPQMSALGMSLSGFDSQELLSNSMATMHIVYWILEASKLILGTALLNNFYRSSCSLV